MNWIGLFIIDLLCEEKCPSGLELSSPFHVGLMADGFGSSDAN